LYNEIKNGTLSPELKEKFIEVCKDFDSNSEYGAINIAQLPRGATIEDLNNQLEQIKLSMDIDLVVIDYLSLLKPTNGQGREGTAELFKDCKGLAVTFDKGRGVPVLTAHQVPNEAKKKCKPTPEKFYRLEDCLADTSEAGKSADIIMCYFRNDKLEAEHEIYAGILKCRDAELPDHFRLYENFASSLIASLSEGST
jgi:replicative DNA helicase